MRERELLHVVGHVLRACARMHGIEDLGDDQRDAREDVVRKASGKTEAAQRMCTSYGSQGKAPGALERGPWTDERSRQQSNASTTAASRYATAGVDRSRGLETGVSPVRG